MPSETLLDAVVLITGGSTGIGRQLAADFARAGARVSICAVDQGHLNDARESLASQGLVIDAYLCDVRSDAGVERMVESIIARFGRIDVLINNAGYAVYRAFEESSPAEIVDLVDVNLVGAMRCAKAVLPYMISRRAGAIVNISSAGGEMIITPNAVYCAAKHAMVAWTKAIRIELERFAVRVSVVCPGHTITNFHDHPTFRRRDPYRRAGRKSLLPKDVSRVVVDLVVRGLDDTVVFVPWWQGVVAWALRALPALTTKAWNSLCRKRVNQLYQQIQLEKRQLAISSRRGE